MTNATSNARDTHFFGFAKLLIAELEKQGFIQPIHGVRPYTLVAQWTYDLLTYGCEHISDAQMIQGVRLHPHAMLRCIPDLTAWPESEMRHE